MGARSAGAGTFWLSACVAAFGLAVVLIAAGCTGEESVGASPLSTPTSMATFETPVVTARATSLPTGTPIPIVEPTAEPSPTPTGTELYGPLLVAGPYDWPLQMPDDLTEDELFAVNIFASAQNASFAAIGARSTDLAEFEPLEGLVASEIFANTGRAIARDTKNGRRQQFDIDGPTELMTITRGEGVSGKLVLRTCEYIVSTFLLDEGEETEGERFTVQRDIRFAETARSYEYEAWAIVEQQNEPGPKCDA